MLKPEQYFQEIYDSSYDLEIPNISSNFYGFSRNKSSNPNRHEQDNSIELKNTEVNND